MSSSFFQKLFRLGGKTNASKPLAKEINPIPENVKINVKGQRVQNHQDGPNINISTLDQDIWGKEKGPVMLETAVRKKVWFGLMMIGCYFYFIYKLIRHRLKSDDLDLMAREVNEDMTIKKKVEEFKLRTKRDIVKE